MVDSTTYTLADLAHAAGASFDAMAGSIPIASISTDTRTLQPGALFVALRGASFDGHAFIDAAIAKGAAAVLVDTNMAYAVPSLVVTSTLRAYGDIAAWVRKQHRGPLVAITGSNGKTTAKELLATVLRYACDKPVHQTYGNLNNFIGVPQTLLAWPQDAWAAVVEMGMNAAGEIARLTEIASPDIGLITCVGEAHLGGVGLGSRAAIAAAKCELFAGLRADGIAIINADDARLCAAANSTLGAQQRLLFGTNSHVDVQLCDYQYAVLPGQTPHMQIKLGVAGRYYTTHMPLLGKHNALHAASAIATVLALGGDIGRAMQAFAHVSLPKGRLHMMHHTWPCAMTLIDDTYNASPSSMRVALQMLADSTTPSHRIAVLGDMLELGAYEKQFHEELAADIVAADVAKLYMYGPRSKMTIDTLKRLSSHLHMQHFDQHADLARALVQDLQPDDWVLFKGSRGMRMEHVITYLKEGF